MKNLLVLDKKDYTEDMECYERYCVRAIIRKGNKIAVQKGGEGDYKILGGGMEPTEDVGIALSREVEEESGLVVDLSTIEEIGEIYEARRDIYETDKKYVCHTWFYYCDVTDEVRSTNMTESEIAKGYHLEWATAQEIIEGNAKFMDQPWIYRDTKFIENFLEKKI